MWEMRGDTVSHNERSYAWIRPVVTLQTGVRIADDNTGDGSSLNSAYKITK